MEIIIETFSWEGAPNVVMYKYNKGTIRGVIDFKNMYKAYRKSKCGKGFKKSSARFSLMALDGINSLIEQLKNN